MNTPITDALIDSGEITRGTTAAAVRKLETELETMTAERDKWTELTAKYAQEREHNANMALAYQAERDELRDKVLSLEFRLSCSKSENVEHEEDYLAIWKLIKRPNENVVEAVKRVIAERDELADGIMEGIDRLKDLTAEREKVEKLRRVMAALHDAFPQSEREDAWCRATFENAATALEETK